MKTRVEELEVICKMDPMKKKPQFHEEMEKLKKQLAEN